jgi:hypothetical protein
MFEKVLMVVMGEAWNEKNPGNFICIQFEDFRSMTIISLSQKINKIEEMS